MIPLEVVLAILDEIRAELIEGVEQPGEEFRSEFGFGKLSGSLSLVKEIRARMESFVEESDRQANAKEAMES